MHPHEKSWLRAWVHITTASTKHVEAAVCGPQSSVFFCNLFSILFDCDHIFLCGASLDLALVRGPRPRFHEYAPLKSRRPPGNVLHCHVLAVRPNFNCFSHRQLKLKIRILQSRGHYKILYWEFTRFSKILEYCYYCGNKVYRPSFSS